MLQERMFKNLDFMVFCYKTRNFHARLIKNSKSQFLVGFGLIRALASNLNPRV